METIKEKRKAWLDSHLKVYLDDPSKRSINGCYYRNPNNGNKCMIGQDIPDELYRKVIEGKSVEDIIVFNILPQSTKELGVDFLQECQWLHDFDKYWNDKGLTECGQLKYNEIIQNYCKQN